jgi:hypothetical protein
LWCPGLESNPHALRQRILRFVMRSWVCKKTSSRRSPRSYVNICERFRSEIRKAWTANGWVLTRQGARSERGRHVADCQFADAQRRRQKRKSRATAALHDRQNQRRGASHACMRCYRFAPKNALLCLPVHVPLAENTSRELPDRRPRRARLDRRGLPQLSPQPKGPGKGRMSRSRKAECGQ